MTLSSGPFFTDRTRSTLFVGENNHESDKCDDGGVVLENYATY